MRIYPVSFVWQKVDLVDGEDGTATRIWAMVPQQRYHNVCQRQFAEGEAYPLQVVEERSMASHRQFFAAVHEGFKNLPENIAARFPSSEHMRKFLLIETGWFDEKEIECANEKHAKALQAFIRTEDEYARIFRRGSLVIIRKAKSQSLAAMGKQAFQDSKRDVLDLLESMVDVPKGTLMREGGMHE